MSSLTSGHRLPPANPVDRETPDHSWGAYLLAGLALVAILYLMALLMAVLA